MIRKLLRGRVGGRGRGAGQGGGQDSPSVSDTEEEAPGNLEISISVPNLTACTT